MQETIFTMLFKFLALLFVFGFFGFLVFGVLLGRVIRFFNPSQKGKTKNNGNTTTGSSSQTYGNTPQKKFSKSEGEYVSYEEIKEDK